MNDNERIIDDKERVEDFFLEYKKGNRTRSQVRAYLSDMMDLARQDERKKMFEKRLIP